MSISETLDQFAQELLPTVRYTFGSRDTQNVHWHVRRVHLRESLSEFNRCLAIPAGQRRPELGQGLLRPPRR